MLPARCTTQSKRSRQAIHELLERQSLHLFITLATNSYGVGKVPMSELYKQWDARVNRRLFGRNWARKSGERLWIFAALEKPRSNPHWHLLVSIRGDLPKRDKTSQKLHTLAGEVWEKLCPRGSVDVQT